MKKQTQFFLAGILCLVLGVNAQSDQAAEFSAETNIESKKKVALTFDDGPHKIYTEKLLDGLEERGIKAAFFVIGSNIPGNEKVIRRMYEAGHVIGNHTYDHVKLCSLTGTQACEQLEKTNELIRQITGENCEYVRPPFGAWNKDMECGLSMIPILWDVDSLDWTTKNVKNISEKVLAEAEDGDIILLHDCYESSVEAALQIADQLQEKGFEFVTADTLVMN